MRLNKTERESLRKRVKIVIPQMKKSEIVNHFQKEGYPQRTIYNTINRLHNGESIKDKKAYGFYRQQTCPQFLLKLAL